MLDAPVVDPEGRLRSGHHAVPGRYVLEANVGPIGEGFAWLARLLHPDEARPEERFTAEAATAAVGSAAMLANVGALVANDRAPAFPVASLALSHMTGTQGRAARASLARSALEGMACAVRANPEQLARVTGRETQRIHLAGGLSRSALFARILAGVTGAEVVRAAAPEATGLGAALCAGVGAGVFADVRRGRARAACARERSRRRSPPSGRLRAALPELERAARGGRVDHRADRDAPHVPGRDRGVAEERAPRRGEPPAAGARHGRVRRRVDRAAARVRRRRVRELPRPHAAAHGPEPREGARRARGAVTEVDVVDAKALEKLPDLRLVAACRGDAVNVDVAACTAYGIPVLFAPGRNADAVADLTVAFLLNLARRLPAATKFLADPAVTAGNLAAMGKAFRGLQGYELWSKTVGLVGLGSVGRAVARRLRGFGVRLLVADPFVSADEAVLAGAEKVELDELLRESDFVSLHAAVTDATRGMIGADQLAA